MNLASNGSARQEVHRDQGLHGISDHMVNHEKELDFRRFQKVEKT